jgi:hypothetical protein
MQSGARIAEKKKDCKLKKTMEGMGSIPPIGQKQRRAMDGAQIHPPVGLAETGLRLTIGCSRSV